MLCPSGGVISGPSDDKACGPDNILLWPCSEHYKRKFKDEDPDQLHKCYMSIWGLSQTCDMYDVCGGKMTVLADQQSVCGSEGAYYKEPEVERMCGICGMFRAQVSLVCSCLDPCVSS